MTNTSLKMEINSMPKAFRDEVSNFIEFLKKKSKSKPKVNAREFGFASGKIILAADFDEPIDEFREYI